MSYWSKRSTHFYFPLLLLKRLLGPETRKNVYRVHAFLIS